MITTPNTLNKVGIFGIYLFAATLPISFVPGEFGIALAALAWIVDGITTREWKVRWHVFFIPFMAYIGWNIVASVFSPRPVHSLLAVADNEWASILMLMMFWTIGSERILRKAVTLFLGVSAVAMIYAIWQTFSGVELYRGVSLNSSGSLFRSVGFYGFYLTFAAFAMTAFFLAAGIALELKDNQRRLFGLVAGLCLAAVIASFARSVWLSIAITLPLFGFLKGRRFGIATTLVLVILSGLLVTAIPSIRDRAASIVDLERNENRLNLWKTSLAMAAAHPLAGVGEDNFDYFVEQFKVEGYYDTLVHPHNDYLNVLISSGVPGLLAFVAMWVIALRTGLRSWRTASSPFIRGTALGASFGLVGLLVACFFQDYYGTFANCMGWWFVVGLIFTSSRLAAGQSSNAEG